MISFRVMQWVGASIPSAASSAAFAAAGNATGKTVAPATAAGKKGKTSVESK